MSFEPARIDVANVVQSIITAHTAYALLVEGFNRELVDQALQTDPYLQIGIKYLGGQQMDMADRPLVGNFGQILFSACVKKGIGEKAANQLMDFCIPYFELKQLSNIRTKVVQPGNAPSVNDWYYVTAFVNFDVYRLST